jgi:hypothetical protein
MKDRMDGEAKKVERAAGANPDPITGVGAQWELRRVLSRTDQRPARHDASVGAHVDHHFPEVAPPFRTR